MLCKQEVRFGLIVNNLKMIWLKYKNIYLKKVLKIRMEDINNFIIIYFIIKFKINNVLLEINWLMHVWKDLQNQLELN